MVGGLHVVGKTVSRLSRGRFKSQPIKFEFFDDEKIGKDCISRKERRSTDQPQFLRLKLQGRQGDGPGPVIPSEYEGSKKKISRFARNKDFSLRSKLQPHCS
jgi:hypothetical protein